MVWWPFWINIAIGPASKSVTFTLHIKPRPGRSKKCIPNPSGHFFIILSEWPLMRQEQAIEKVTYNFRFLDSRMLCVYFFTWEQEATWNRSFRSPAAPCTLEGSPLSRPGCPARPWPCWPGSGPASVWRTPPRRRWGPWPTDREADPYKPRVKLEGQKRVAELKNWKVAYTVSRIPIIHSSS